MTDTAINSLAKRAIAGMAGLLIPLAALIFVSAGTIHFWQGWVFWLSFSVSVIATTAYLLKRDPALVERRMRGGPRAESRPTQKIIQAINLAMFVAIVIVPGLDYRFGWSQVPAAIVVIANVLVMAAFGFILLVFREKWQPGTTGGHGRSPARGALGPRPGRLVRRAALLQETCARWRRRRG